MNLATPSDMAISKKAKANNVLVRIVDDKRQEIAHRKQSSPLASFIEQVKPSTRSLAKALRQPEATFILECKKASPSKGLIRDDFNLDEILSVYADYASAVSVLTDEKYFQGSFDYLQQASQTLQQPILCKDFFIDIYQVYLARLMGADAILLMLSVLDDEQYRALARAANKLNLDILTEVHSEQELERALALDAKIIGINNRDLRDLSINLSTTEKLAKQIPDNHIVISESGINNHDDVLRLSPQVNGFLIGSSIMAQANIREACKAIVYGRTKVCGLTRPKDAKAAFDAGAIYGGLIFYSGSRRAVDVTKANQITAAAPLKFVGVFVDAAAPEIIETCRQLKLHAIQLHGNERQSLIDTLKHELAEVEIWKAIPVLPHQDIDISVQADRYLFDTATTQSFGGSGRVFDWQKVSLIPPYKRMLAGGLNPDNLPQAAQQGAYSLDINSGVEEEPGLKSSTKIKKAFAALKAVARSNQEF